MGGTRTLVCVLALAGGNEAQQLHLLRCGDAFVGPAAAASDAGGEARTIARFAEICERLTVAEGRQRMDGTMLRLQKTNAGKLLLVRDTADNIELVTKAVEQLMAEDAANPTRWRLQCSLVTLPAKVAAERGIVAGKVVPVDEAAASRLVRDAVAAKGSLQNLPEVVVNPLVPFVVERRGPRERRAADKEPRVRGEAFALGADEIVVGLQVVRGPLDRDRTKMPADALLDQALRLRVGTGALLATKADEQGNTTVLWVRLLGVE